GKVLAPPEGLEATQSSVSGTVADNGADNLMRLKGIHSSAEAAPWWEVRFTSPIDADEIRITNRSDGWGIRSRTLRVEAIDADGSERCLHDGQSPVHLVAALAEATR